MCGGNSPDVRRPPQRRAQADSVLQCVGPRRRQADRQQHDEESRPSRGTSHERLMTRLGHERSITRSKRRRRQAQSQLGRAAADRRPTADRPRQIKAASHAAGGTMRMHSVCTILRCNSTGGGAAGRAAAARSGRRRSLHFLALSGQPTPDLAGSRCYETMT
jgi:hypothetical protein